MGSGNLPISSVHNKIRRLAYQFIWDGRKGIPRNKMLLFKKEGGLGVRNLHTIVLATPIKKAATI